MSICNNLSLADDRELQDAYDLVMLSASQEINKEMSEVACYPFSESARVARIICHQNPVIFNLVNKQLEVTQTAERQKVRASKKKNFLVNKNQRS